MKKILYFVSILAATYCGAMDQRPISPEAEHMIKTELAFSKVGRAFKSDELFRVLKVDSNWIYYLNGNRVDWRGNLGISCDIPIQISLGTTVGTYTAGCPLAIFLSKEHQKHLRHADFGGEVPRISSTIGSFEDTLEELKTILHPVLGERMQRDWDRIKLGLTAIIGEQNSQKLQKTPEVIDTFCKEFLGKNLIPTPENIKYYSESERLSKLVDTPFKDIFAFTNHILRHFPRFDPELIDILERKRPGDLREKVKKILSGTYGCFGENGMTTLAFCSNPMILLDEVIKQAKLTLTKKGGIFIFQAAEGSKISISDNNFLQGMIVLHGKPGFPISNADYIEYISRSQFPREIPVVFNFILGTAVNTRGTFYIRTPGSWQSQKNTRTPLSDALGDFQKTLIPLNMLPWYAQIRSAWCLKPTTMKDNVFNERMHNLVKAFEALRCGENVNREMLSFVISKTLADLGVSDSRINGLLQLEVSEQVEWLSLYIGAARGTIGIWGVRDGITMRLSTFSKKELELLASAGKLFQ